MKLVLVGPAYPLRGGIAQFTGLLCQELSRRHDVTLFSFRRQYPSFLFPGRSQLEPGADRSRFPAQATIDSIGPSTWFSTAARIGRLRPDAVVLRHWIPFLAPAVGTIARRLGSLRGARACVGEAAPTGSPAARPRLILICDNVVPHEGRILDSLLTRYILGSVDSFLVMTESVRTDLLARRPGARVALVPHPLYTQFGEPIPRDEARRRLGWPPEGPLLLFFGYVRDYKGLDTLLRAMPAIRARIGASLHVAGEFYEGRSRYDAIVRAEGLGASVRMDGSYVPGEDVAALFSAADLVVLPYRSATQSGIVPIATAFGRPVVSTRVGGLVEMVEEGSTGLLVPPEDPAALAAAVIRYFEEGMQERLTAGVRQRMDERGWDRFAEAIEKLAGYEPPAKEPAAAGQGGASSDRQG